MEIHFTDLLRAGLALAAGGLIGWAFGLAQDAALRRNEERQRSGQLNSGWSLVPGSGARVAYLLLVLIAVQLVCPLLFAAGTQWLVSAGVLVGYGWMLFTQMRRRLRASTH
jgi:hypothetical protein